MNIFDLTTGERYTIASSVEIDGVDYGRIQYSAVATDKFSVIRGRMHRLFVDTDPPLPNGSTEIWLNDERDTLAELLFGAVQSRNEDCDPRPQVHFLEPALLPETLGA